MSVAALDMSDGQHDVIEVDTGTAHEPAGPTENARWGRVIGSGGLWGWAIVAVLMPLCVHLVVRPDWYFRLNGLDSYFYTGYAQNLNNILAMGGEVHYFVSRWTLYLPNHLFFRLFGAPEGFLILRWLSASLVTACIIAIGRRRWRTADILALCLFVLISPMFIRTVMTDYSDSVTVPLGVLAIVVAALRPTSLMTAAIVGACGASIAIGNPVAASVVICLAPAWLAVVGTWKQRTTLIAIALVAGTTVVALGWGLFRLRYDIPNVYSPTIDFARNNSGRADPSKSPRLWWMGYRIWIYLPLIIIVSWRYLVKVKKVAFDSTETMILATCAVQYAFQIWYQFGRHGMTLEIPYYWSLMVPALLLGIAVLAGKVARCTPSWLLPTVVGLIVLGGLVFRDGFPGIYSSWLDALVVIIVIAALMHRSGDRFPSLLACALLVIVFTFQVGAPRPEPLLPGESIIDASYESALNRGGSDGIDGYESASWFVEHMKQLDIETEQASFFWIGSGRAHAMAAMYNAHVTGRWLNSGWGEDSAGLQLTPDFEWAVETGVVDVITMVGTADEVATMSETLATFWPDFTVLLEGSAPDRLETQVKVVRKTPG